MKQLFVSLNFFPQKSIKKKTEIISIVSTRFFMLSPFIDFIHRMFQNRDLWSTWFWNDIFHIQCNVRFIENTELTRNETKKWNKTEKCIIRFLFRFHCCSFYIVHFFSFCIFYSLTLTKRKRTKTTTATAAMKVQKTNRIVHDRIETFCSLFIQYIPLTIIIIRSSSLHHQLWYGNASAQYSLHAVGKFNINAPLFLVWWHRHMRFKQSRNDVAWVRCISGFGIITYGWMLKAEHRILNWMYKCI